LILEKCNIFFLDKSGVQGPLEMCKTLFNLAEYKSADDQNHSVLFTDFSTNQQQPGNNQ